MHRSAGGRLLAPLVQVVARWGDAGGAAPSTAAAAAGLGGIGFVRHSGTFPKDTSSTSHTHTGNLLPVCPPPPGILDAMVARWFALQVFVPLT